MKNMLMIICLILAVQICAIEIVNWSEISFNLFTAEADEEIEIMTSASQEAKLGLRYRHDLTAKISDKFKLTVLEDIYFSEKSFEQKNSFLYGDSKLKLFYTSKNHFLKLQFSSRNYHSDYTRFLANPSFNENIQQNQVINSILEYQTNWHRFELDLFNNFRDMRFQTEDEYSHNDNDLYSHVQLSFKLNNEWKAYSKMNYKNALNENSTFDQIDLGGGIEFDKRFDLFSSIFADLFYLRTDSDRLSYKDQFQLRARYTRRFRNGLAGYISMINNSYYDQNEKKIMNNSGMIKVFAKYSYLTQHFRNSFLIAGIKLNPLHDGNLAFAQLNQQLIDNLFLGAEAKFAPKLYAKFSGNLEYFINPVRSIWIKNEISDFNNEHSQNILSLGSTLLF